MTSEFFYITLQEVVKKNAEFAMFGHGMKYPLASILSCNLQLSNI